MSKADQGRDQVGEGNSGGELEVRVTPAESGGAVILDDEGENGEDGVAV